MFFLMALLIFFNVNYFNVQNLKLGLRGNNSKKINFSPSIDL